MDEPFCFYLNHDDNVRRSFRVNIQNLLVEHFHVVRKVAGNFEDVLHVDETRASQWFGTVESLVYFKDTWRNCESISASCKK